jgi:PAS domain S-box-containing protein
MISVLHTRDQLWRHLTIGANGDPIETLAARTLRSLLLGVLLWLVVFAAVSLPFAARRNTGFLLAILLLFSVLASVAALGKGRVKLASWIFLSSLWFVATVLTIFSGGIASRGLMLYLSISIMAAWLLGRRAALLSAGLFLGMALVLALLEIAGVHLPKFFPGSPIVVWMMLLLFAGIAILPMSEVLLALETALKRTQEKVDDLKLRELALQESEERCRLALEAGRMFAFEWNPVNDEVRRSADCTNIFGIRGDATREAGRESLQRVHPDDQNGLIQAVKTLTPAKDSYKTEYRAIHSNGQIVSLQQSGRAFFDSTGQMIRVIGITADITERKRTEAALRESEDRFRHVADAVPVSLWVTGPDGLVSFWNKSALRFTGRTMEELVGNNWSDLIHPDDRVACRAAFSSAVADRGEFHIECRLLRADGEYRWCLCTGVPHFSPDGIFLGLVGSSVDITELRQAHQEALARQKLESLGVLGAC